MTWRRALVPLHVLVTLSAGAFACASGAPAPQPSGAPAPQPSGAPAPQASGAPVVSASAEERVRADTPVPVEKGCPAAAPTEKSACGSAGRLCTYASSLGCGTVYDCHLGKWRVALPVACTDAHRDGACAPEPERDRAPKTPLEKSPICLYSGATACSYHVDAPPQPCSGVPRQVPPPKFVWRCNELTSGGCGAGFAEGERCAPEGVSCGTTCCGTSAVCSGGKWHVTEHGCPPQAPGGR
ncbi:hypothetical protein [Polyangium sp. y55x31]|uniref:hypothetical protein n=1 Tax=Polyangium sp. y55x31 TaxID=3042688 RepID=UPI002482266F|nr:hypothetical protein [Polyangium sp. y55x31]